MPLGKSRRLKPLEELITSGMASTLWQNQSQLLVRARDQRENFQGPLKGRLASKPGRARSQKKKKSRLPSPDAILSARKPASRYKGHRPLRKDKRRLFQGRGTALRLHDGKGLRFYSRRTPARRGSERSSMHARERGRNKYLHWLAEGGGGFRRQLCELRDSFGSLFPFR